MARPSRIFAVQTLQSDGEFITNDGRFESAFGASIYAEMLSKRYFTRTRVVELTPCDEVINTFDQFNNRI